MNTLPLLIFSLALALPAQAQKKPIGDKPPVEEKAPPESHDSALDELLAAHTTRQDLEHSIEKARKNGVNEQAILEARFLFHVDRNDDDAIVAMLPEFMARKATFKLEDSSIFSVEEDWKAVTEYVQAIAALKQGDRAAFKTHITEAFWLSPKQAAAFGPKIEQLRLNETMEAITIDLEQTFIPLAGGEAVVLKKLMEGKKALVIHFWSAASPQCEEGMPDYIITAKALTDHGIVMVSMLPEKSLEAQAAARKIIAPLGKKPPGEWLVDHAEKPLARELRIQTLPTFVLISNEGKILFNGDPSEQALWDKLHQVDPGIERPVIRDKDDH